MPTTRIGRRAALGAALAAPALMRSAWAATEIRITRQVGISSFPMLVTASRGLIEAEGKRRGLAITTANSRVGNATAINDAILSRNTDLGCVSISPLLTLWERTRGAQRVMGLTPLDSSAASLNTNQDRIRSLADFGDNDRIALPDVGISYQALMLQMACEKRWGEADVHRLDRLTVSMAHPDGAAALMAGRTEITAHFTSPPYSFQEVESGKARLLMTSRDILGGPGTFQNLVCTSAFHDANPEITASVLAAVQEAQRWITANPEDAAQIYVREEQTNLQPDFVARVLRDPLVRYSGTPERIGQVADFSVRIGRLKTKLASWKDVYFEDIHTLPGT